MYISVDEFEDDIPASTVRTKCNATEIPYEPRLFDQKKKKDVVNIDLIVVDSIASTVDNFDIVICKCLFDGKKFNIPRPTDTFGRRSGLSNCLEVSKTQAYTTRIVESGQRTFKSIVSEIRTGGYPSQLTNFWQLRDEEKRNLNLLRSAGIVNNTEAMRELEMTIDHFNVFSEKLDSQLPHPIALIVNTIRAILIENSLVESKLIHRRAFFPENRASRPHPQFGICARRLQKTVAVNLFSRHNVFVKSLNRLAKYRNRGIQIEPTNYPPVECQALRELEIGVMCGAFGSDSDDDSGDGYSYERSYGPAVDRMGHIEERAEARERKRWDAYRELVEEAKHKAWVASIPCLPPLGIVFPTDQKIENCVEKWKLPLDTDETDGRKRKAIALGGVDACRQEVKVDTTKTRVPGHYCPVC